VTAASLCHYTVDTGRRYQSPRSEVGAEVIAQLAPLLVEGDHPLPGPTGYRARILIDGSTLYATVKRAGGGDLISVIVLTEEKAAAKATIEGLNLTAPCCLVKLHLGMAHCPQSAGWLGDLARCLAWAWIERRELGRALTVPLPVS
jgi:hypothetical protein